MKIELDQVKQQLMFTDQEKQLMETTTEFTKKDTQTKSIISETSNKIDAEIASLKTLMDTDTTPKLDYLSHTELLKYHLT
uniref:Coiled-coil domain containing 90B n=1 Tax=Mandrillus leucophaeus TaxID=9568 RepID=A0A2K5YRI6_MANLE